MWYLLEIDDNVIFVGDSYVNVILRLILILIFVIFIGDRCLCDIYLNINVIFIGNRCLCDDIYLDVNVMFIRGRY